MARGALRIYLGASPGVGKTFAMLNEGQRRAERGADVVIGVVETHGRANTAAQIGSLPLIPRRAVEHRGVVLEEMDVEALLTRRPKLVLVDEYAHTNAPGSAREKRWQDVELLLDAGIDVISTLNIQHLESLNDVVRRITGVTQRETVPDDVVRRAEQIELVDMSPEAIRRRLAHGNIYPPERVDVALANYFRPGNLGALRELALLWVADRVEASLADYLEREGITDAWETRERVVVGITGGEGGDTLIRRAARIAGRVGGDLIGVHVVTSDGLRQVGHPGVADQRRLLEQLGGSAHEIVGTSRADALVEFARAHKATQLVIGSSRRSRLQEFARGSVAARVIRTAGAIDVHVIASNFEQVDDRAHVEPTFRSSSRRRLAAWVLAALGLPLLTVVTLAMRDRISLQSELLLFLSLVLGIAALGGRRVALSAAVVASLLVNWFFVEPYYTLTIADSDNLIALAVFLLVAATVGWLVDILARRSFEAVRARVEAETLARSAATLAADAQPVTTLLAQLRSTFEFDEARLSRREANDTWTIVIPSDGEPGAIVGELVPTTLVPTTLVPIGDQRDPTYRLELYGRVPTADDLRVIRVLAAQLGTAVETQHLASEAVAAASLAAIDEVRTALLRAVSHDLRTPIASVKAMVSGLLDDSVAWTSDQLHEALTTIDQETDRLNRLVGNLLDASRLQAGALAVHLEPVELHDVVGHVMEHLSDDSVVVTIAVPDDVPLVMADGALLERSVANIVANATRHARGAPVRVVAGVMGDHVHLCVIDTGPGIPIDLRDKVVAPFQRLDDTAAGAGVGLGLSIAQGFVVAMGGQFSLDDTPGGGLTVTIGLPIAVRCEPTLSEDAT